jgi:cyclopropane fatty-acyl-phospholipid synthase-like methyltransferase
MSEHVCPWWIGYFLVSPLRRWMQNPDELIVPYVTPGMTVLEPGPGMGFFTLPLARRAGSGRVIAVDIQAKMLDALRRRATKAGLAQRIETRLASAASMGIDDLKGMVDFILAVAVVHEMPSAEAFFREAAAALAPGGRLLLAEPSGHVSEARFAEELTSAEHAGLAVKQRPAVKRCHAALLAKEAS